MWQRCESVIEHGDIDGINVYGTMYVRANISFVSFCRSLIQSFVSLCSARCGNDVNLLSNTVYHPWCRSFHCVRLVDSMATTCECVIEVFRTRFIIRSSCLSILGKNDFDHSDRPFWENHTQRAEFKSNIYRTFSLRSFPHHSLSSLLCSSSSLCCSSHERSLRRLVSGFTLRRYSSSSSAYCHLCSSMLCVLTSLLAVKSWRRWW